MASSAPDEPGQAEPRNSGFETLDWGKGLLFLRLPLAEPFRASYLGVPGIVRGTDPHTPTTAQGASPAAASDGGDPDGPPSALLHPLDRAGYELDRKIKEGSLLLLGVLLVTLGAAALLFIHRDTVASVAKTAAVAA